MTSSGLTPGRRRAQEYHTPSNLVVAHWTADVESTAPLGVLLRHNLWIPFWCLISCKIRSIISVACDFTTKSDGICALSVVRSHHGHRLRLLKLHRHDEGCCHRYVFQTV